MPTCVAFGCKNRASKKIPGITFHQFPKNEELRDAWTRAIRRRDWKPTIHSTVCSEHFDDTDFDRSSCFRVRLKDDVIPSKFKEYAKQLQKMVSSCSALYCSSRDTQESKANGISFHKFPQNPKLRRKWAKATRCSTQWIPPKSANLCSKHFTPEDFEVHQCSKRLREGVIPSIFYFPESFSRRLKSKKWKQLSQGSSSNEDGKLKVCCALGCKNTSQMQSYRVSFHEFPSNALLRAQWINAVKNCDFWVPTSNSVLCSDHFTNDQFSRAHVLKFGAIPSIFHPKSSDPQSEQEANQGIPVIMSCSVPLKRLKMDPGDVVRVLTVLPSEFVDDTLESPGNKFEGNPSAAIRPLDVEHPEYESTTPAPKNCSPEICSDHIYASTSTSVLNDHLPASVDANTKLGRILLEATNISKECNLENPTNMEVPVSPDVVFLCKNSKDPNPKPLLISGLPSVGGKPLLISNHPATASQTSAIVDDIISRARQAALKAVSAKGDNSPILTGISSNASSSPILLLVQPQPVPIPTSQHSQLVTSLNQSVPLSQSIPATTSAQHPNIQKPKTLYTLAGLTPKTSNIPSTSSTSQSSLLNYIHLNSKLNRQLATSKSVIKNYQRKVKNLTGALRRQKLKIQSMEKELAKLMKKKSKYDQFQEGLENCPPKNRALLESQLLTTGNEVKVYSDEVKVFASTLYCYSTKAYAYVRSSLLTNLPTPKTIKRWCTQPEPSSKTYTSNSHSLITEAVNTIPHSEGNTQPVSIVSWCNPSEVQQEGSSRESATEGKETSTAHGQQMDFAGDAHKNGVTALVQENNVNAPRPTLQPIPQTTSSQNVSIVKFVDNTVAASSIAQENNANAPRTIYLYIPGNMLPVGSSSVSYAVATETTSAIDEGNGTHLPVTVIDQVSQDVSQQEHAQGSTHDVLEAVDFYVEETVSTIEHVEQQESCADS